MPITLAVGEEAIDAAKTEEEEQKPQASLDLIVRKTADGNIMIMDHTDIDVIVMPQKNKVLTIAKNALTDDVYDSQNRLFKYLSKKGLIDLSSIRSGNIYGSLEAAYIAETFNGADPAETIVFGVGKFMEEEKPYFMYNSKLEDDEMDRLTKPEDGTDLGEVPHAPRKGILPLNPHSNYYTNTSYTFSDKTGLG